MKNIKNLVVLAFIAAISIPSIQNANATVRQQWTCTYSESENGVPGKTTVLRVFDFACPSPKNVGLSHGYTEYSLVSNSTYYQVYRGQTAGMPDCIVDVNGETTGLK